MADEQSSDMAEFHNIPIRIRVFKIADSDGRKRTKVVIDEIGQNLVDLLPPVFRKKRTPRRVVTKEVAKRRSFDGAKTPTGLKDIESSKVLEPSKLGRKRGSFDIAKQPADLKGMEASKETAVMEQIPSNNLDQKRQKTCSSTLQEEKSTKEREQKDRFESFSLFGNKLDKLSLEFDDVKTGFSKFSHNLDAAQRTFRQILNGRTFKQ